MAPATQRLSVRSDGLPATVEVPVQVTASAGTPAGSYQVTLEITDGGGLTVTRPVTVKATR